MIGAILGDIIGSRFEMRPILHEDFDLFGVNCGFTDDTVMIIAIADAYMNNKPPEDALREWFNKYPNLLWGPNFRLWAQGKRASKKSTGNGALVRVCALPFLISDPNELATYALSVTRLSHNSKEARQCVLTSILYINQLLNRQTKEHSLLYDLSIPNMQLNYVDLWLQTLWSTECYNTLPHAVASFKVSTSFEETIRKAVSFGSDSDTMAAVAGTFAEAYYGLEEFDKKYNIEAILDTYLPQEMIKIIHQFIAWRKNL